jgi:hypothetical protein
LVLLGCEHVYGQVPALVESLLGIQVNQSQVYRSCQRAAFVADEGVLDEPSSGLGEQLSDQEQTVYGMVDGSMLPTEQGWQEVKVGRVFAGQPFQAAQSARKKEPDWELSESEYVALRGNYEEFTAKFEQLFPPSSSCRKVLLTDGAIWMSKWLLQAYPGATHILDYYHLKQKLALAAQATENGKEWLQEQENRLFQGQQQQVETAIEVLEHLEQTTKDQLLEYLKTTVTVPVMISTVKQGS